MDDKKKKVYIAGKITGNKDYKKEFRIIENALKSLGYIVMNPSVLPEGFEHDEYLRVNMAMIDICDEVHFMPSWIDSKGSYFEYGYCKGTGKKIVFL